MFRYQPCAGIAIGRAHQGDAQVVRTLVVAQEESSSAIVSAGNVSGLDFPVFINPQLDPALEIFPPAARWASPDIAGDGNRSKASIEKMPIV